MSSGILSAEEVLDLLDSLRESKLYRADQESYMLYPNKKLPLFLDKNNLDPSEVQLIPLLKQLLDYGDSSILTTDHKGQFHFNSNFNNVNFLNDALNRLKLQEKFDVTEKDVEDIRNIYEKVFDHQSFTGRSGTFYKYEGLGCIYWHMVSKLLLAVGECIQKAALQKADDRILDGLKRHYEAVQSGIGAHKKPQDYGSFPFDPYSHTPSTTGVQQPGMTGQVKEDILNRFFELGMIVANGQLSIQPILLKASEYIHSTDASIAPSLSFTYCNVPFFYVLDGGRGIDFILQDGTLEQSNSYALSVEQSHAIFLHDHRINKVIVHF